MKIRLGEYEINVTANINGRRATAQFINELAIVYFEASEYLSGRGSNAISTDFQKKARQAHYFLVARGHYKDIED